MYVSIVRNGSTAFFECDEARIKPDGEDHVFLTMEAENKHTKHHKIEKKTSEIYIMNQNGKTIDSYRWRTEG